MGSRIPLPNDVLAGTGRLEQCGLDDRALLHGPAALPAIGFHGPIEEVFSSTVDRLAEVDLLGQVAADQNHCLAGNALADALDPGETAQAGFLDQRRIHALGTECRSPRHQMDPQQSLRGSQELRLQQIWRQPAEHAASGLVGLDPIDGC